MRLAIRALSTVRARVLAIKGYNARGRAVVGCRAVARRPVVTHAHALRVAVSLARTGTGWDVVCTPLLPLSHIARARYRRQRYRRAWSEWIRRRPESVRMHAYKCDRLRDYPLCFSRFFFFLFISHPPLRSIIISLVARTPDSQIPRSHTPRREERRGCGDGERVPADRMAARRCAIPAT